MKRQKLLNTKKIAKKIQQIQADTAHRVTLSDLDEYEKILYGYLKPIFDTNILEIETGLLAGLTEIAFKYIANETGFERFNVAIPWDELYKEAIQKYLAVFVPGLSKELLKDKDSSDSRLLTITVTEATRMTGVCAVTIMTLYNEIVSRR